MQYALELVPTNPDVIIIHTLKKLAERGKEYDPDTPTGKEFPEFINTLLALDGITSMHLNQYSIALFKAPLYAWSDILPLVLFAVQQHYCPQDDLVEIPMPTRLPRTWQHKQDNPLSGTEIEIGDQ